MDTADTYNNDSDSTDCDFDLSDNKEQAASEDESCVDGNLSDTEISSEQVIPITLPKNMFKFQNKHPLYNTHVAILKPANPTMVVNFIGLILPRCDQGDREFYCLTMLAF